LLVALVAFERGETALAGDTADRPLYWVYSFLRGACYPFAPVGDHERDDTTECKLASVRDGELDVEDHERDWYPLWPESSRGHPWD
jgi:hypothetical protein